MVVRPPPQGAQEAPEEVGTHSACGQREQAVDPPLGAYSPGAQDMHCAELGTLVKEPGAQGVQAVALAKLNVPGGQMLQEVLLFHEPEAVPAAQPMHTPQLTSSR